MRILFTFFICLISVCLTACSFMNSSFDCPNQAGVMCQSLDQINNRVDKGQIRGASQEISVTKTSASYGSFEPYHSTNHAMTTPLRQGETVQRVWIAPFEDLDGNYHQESMIYTVVRSGWWVRPST